MADNILEMDALKTSITNAIKTLRSHKKRLDELTILELLKKISKPQLLQIMILMKT